MLLTKLVIELGGNAWSLLRLPGSYGPRRSADGGAATSTVDGPTDAVTLALPPSFIGQPGAPIPPPVGRGDAADARC